jgi:glycosyltransferase involved in cell wall biosynthesis
MPVVSVIVITYQHEQFIAQAVESVLRQQTRFPVEILISEDCSADATRAIVTDLQRRHPDRIQLFLSERNQNDNEVITRAWAVARGKYIAVLDGDDYWTDPLKLQKQVDFLEQHPSVFICGHAVSFVDGAGQPLADTPPAPARDRAVSREDLAAGYMFHVVAALFRNNRVMPPAASFNNVYNADTYMSAFFSNFGSGHVLRDVMGAYRIHAGGAWSTLDLKRAADHRNVTLWRIPRALHGSMRSVAYAACLAHALWEDYRWPRKLRQIPHAALMMLVYMTPRTALYLAKRAWLRAGR